MAEPLKFKREEQAQLGWVDSDNTGFMFNIKPVEQSHPREDPRDFAVRVKF